MKKKIFTTLSGLFFGAFLLIGAILYFYQEYALFESKPLPKNYAFNWDEEFEEVFIETDSETLINGLYFKTNNPKGVVFFLHGKGGNLQSWGKRAKPFLRLGYNTFMIDYRGFGKSQGKRYEQGILEDVEKSYQFVTKNFSEDKIVVYGCSLGTGLATYIASKHNPRSVILQSPYTSILDLADRMYPFLPRFYLSFILKYPFRADLWIEKVQSPIHILHGNRDTVIPYDCSLTLFEKMKSKIKITLSTIENADHEIFFHTDFQAKLAELLR